jgi:hypothetical protein
VSSDIGYYRIVIPNVQNEHNDKFESDVNLDINLTSTSFLGK